MPSLVTTKFRIHNAKQFREMFDEAALYGGATASAALSTNMYLFIGKSDAWSGAYTTDGGTAYTNSDTSVPDPNNSNAPSSDTTANTSYTHWKDMIAAKKVASSDVSHVIGRNNWTSGRYYAMYDDTETFGDLTSSRAAQDVYTGSANATATLYPMYVMNTNYGVYKCLFNDKTEGGRPTPSTIEPTATTTTAGAPAALADGYVWKYMYTISAAEALKFVTTGYIPVKQIRDANAYGEGASTGGMAAAGVKDDGSDQVTVERNALNGALDIFVISNDGANYHFENNIAIYNSGSTTTSLILTSPGLTANDRYNNCSVYFTFSGTSYVRKVTDSVWDSGNSRMTLTVTPTLGSITLSGSLTANIAPHARIDGDGHGHSIQLTANATAANSVGGVTVIATGNSYTTATLTVEQQGTAAGAGGAVTPIIGPYGGHGYDAAAELGGFFVMVNSKLTQDESGAFTTSNDFRKIGLLKDPNNDNTFVRTTAATATQSKTFTYSANSAVIGGDITISQTAAGGASAYVVDVNATASTMRVIDVTNGSSDTAGYDTKPGSWQTSTVAQIGGGGTFTLSAVANGAMRIGSGEIIYVENRAPVARAADQTEDIKLIIEF
jgi:hypothetical protein